MADIANKTESWSGHTLGEVESHIKSRLNTDESIVGFYTCGTAAATAAKVVAASNYVLTDGGSIKIKFTYVNSVASPTLNINSTGAKAIVYNGTVASATNTWEAGDVVEFYYDPTYNSNVGAYIGIPTVVATPAELSQLGQYVDNPEWVKVVTDNDGIILYGVKTDGKFYFGDGCPPQVVEYIQDKINELSLDEYKDIVIFLGDLIDGDTLTTLLNAKLDAEGLNSEALETIQAVENHGYIKVTTDSENKIIEGITSEGTKQINIPVETPSASIESVENHEWIRVITDDDGNVLEGITKEGISIKYIPAVVSTIKRMDAGEILTLHPKEKILPVLRNLKMRYIQAPEYTPNYSPLNLLWFSDIHADVDNLRRITEFSNEYNALIDGVISTGDNCEYNATDDYNWWINNGGNKILTALGNHDANTLYASLPYCYKKFYEPFAGELGMIIGANKTYWYKDYPRAKSSECPNGIRLICLDQYHWKNSSVTYNDGTTGDDGEQEAWFVNLLENSRTNGLAVIVMLHAPTNAFTHFDDCTFQLPDYNPMGEETGLLSSDMLQDVQDFIDAGGEFITWLTGHLHEDWFGVSSKHPKQTIISIGTASHTIPYRVDDMVDGTISQDRFNIISVEPNRKYLRIFRVGLEFDRHSRHIGSLLYNYLNNELMYNN